MLPKTVSSESFKSSNCEPTPAITDAIFPIPTITAPMAIGPANVFNLPPMPAAPIPKAAPPTAPVVFILPSILFNSFLSCLVSALI